MSLAFEFPDSEIRDVVAEGDAVRIRFSAAAVRDADRVHGWLPSVVLTLARATLDGDVAHAVGQVVDASVRQDGRSALPLALPGTLAGDLELTLSLANGTLLVARARSLALTVADDARFSEDLSC